MACSQGVVDYTIVPRRWCHSCVRWGAREGKLYKQQVGSHAQHVIVARDVAGWVLCCVGTCGAVHASVVRS